MDPFIEHFTHTPITKPPIPRAEPPDLDTHKDWGQPKLISAHLVSPNCKPISPSGTPPLCTHSGLLHSRIAVFMPPPQVLEQVPKGLQVPQAPSVTGASRSLGTHIPNLQCCKWTRDMAKVGLCCFAIWATNPGNKTQPHLFLSHTRWFCNQIKLNYFIFRLSPPCFSFSVPLNGKVKARCSDCGMIYSTKTEDNSNYWIFLFTGAKQRGKLTALAFQKPALIS